jgi:hypothetical protein
MIAAVLCGGCNNKNINQGNVTPTVTPTPSDVTSPSPSPTATPQPEPGDTVIVIKDGSINMKVFKTLCADDTTGVDTYNCENITIHDVRVFTETGSPVTCSGLTPNSKITIHSDQASKAIEVKNNPNKIKIKFSKAVYPECGTLGTGTHCGTNHVEKVQIDTQTLCKTCTPADKCEIRIRKQP